MPGFTRQECLGWQAGRTGYLAAPTTITRMMIIPTMLVTTSRKESCPAVLMSSGFGRAMENFLRVPVALKNGRYFAWKKAARPAKAASS